jgi:hypothetical protein
MKMHRVWTGLVVSAMLAVPIVVLTYDGASAQGAAKAEWRTKKTTTAAPKLKKASQAAPVTPSQLEAPDPKAAPLRATLPDFRGESSPDSGSALGPDSGPALGVEPAIADQSQEVLDIDFAMAQAIATQGPKEGYATALSDEGILYDANGGSPPGRDAAIARFGTFPADVTLVRTPESALAAGGSGSSWGAYTIMRATTILSSGRYVSVWRREAGGWKMISELAAGKTIVPPPASALGGTLPKRPTTFGRAPPPPVGQPLTIPTLLPDTPAETLPPSR